MSDAAWSDDGDAALPESPLVASVRRAREPALPVLVVAHRGDSQNAPENTLAAFEAAIAHRAELIEFDVHETADGDVVVIHDDALDRTTDARGDVLRTSTRAVREASAGAWFGPRFRNERVPLLDEVLDLCARHRVVPLVEIKPKRRRTPELGRKVGEALARHGLGDKACVICEPARAADVRAASPLTLVAQLTFTKRQARHAVRQPGVSGVDCYWRSLSLALVAELRQGASFVVPWTVNKGRDMERLFLLGCEAICTDSPALLRDRIEGFEFERTRDLLARFRRGEASVDVDLESDPEAEDPAPDELARRAVSTDSSLDLQLE